MTRSDEEVRRAWQAAATPPSRESCLSSDEVTELAFGARADRAAADHVMNCAPCAEEIRAVREAAAAAGQLVTPAPALAGRAEQMAIAALLVLALGLGALSLVQRQRTEALEDRVAELQRAGQQRPTVIAPPATSAPPPVAAPAAWVNIAIVDLEPGFDRTRGAGQTAAIAPLPNAAAYTFVMTIDPQPAHEDYTLEIADAKGTILFSARGVQRSAQDTFTLGLERRLLPAGVHRVDLFGVDDARRTKIASYSVRVPSP